MNKNDLKKRITEVLGVSVTQSDLAYEIFLENLSQALTYGITLKIPRIGFFQLKENNDEYPSQILFARLPEDYSTSSKNFYLTLDIQNNFKNKYEIDSQVFSIGVGKPLLPLLNYDEQNSDTSFELLKKSIEERAKEILSEADQIPNYNIWEEFYFEDNDENFFDNSKDELNENITIDTNKNLLDSLLSETTFDDSIDYKEEDNTMNQKIEDEINSLNLEIDNNLSLEHLLTEENIESNEELIDEDIQENLQQKLNDVNSNINDNDVNEEKNFNKILSFADELKNKIEELEKINKEILDDSLLQKELNEEKKLIDNKEEINNNLTIDDKNYSIDQDSSIYEEKNETLNINNYENDTSSKLRSLLDEKEEEQSIREEEINVEPPATAKELIIDDFNFVKDEIINIEESELKEIVNNEINNLSENVTVDDNSTILTKLLKEEQLEKIENENDDKEFENEEEIEINTSSTNIEWNWGDELKEEFGIGNIESIELEKVEKIENEENLNVDKSYEESPTVELRKTRVDLFTKLEETLEREINFLKNDLIEREEEKIKFEKPEIIEREAVIEKSIEMEKDYDSFKNEEESVFNINDEKVILDFKTPPPQYEFIEEKSIENIIQDEEPILKPPKKITIILSPEEQENLAEKKTITKTLEKENTEVEIIQTIPEKKNYIKKITAPLIILTVLIVTSYFIFNYFTSKSSESQKLTTNQTNDRKINSPQENSNNNNLQSLSEETQLQTDEFSDFPISATPPKPVKSGGEINIEQLLPKEINKESKTIIPVQPKEESSKKITTQKEQTTNAVNKKEEISNTQKEIKLSNMIFYDGKSYIFQTSSWKNKSLAENEVNRLRSIGFNAFLSEAYLPQKGGTWYRVRIGYFNSEQEALEFKQKNNF